MAAPQNPSAKQLLTGPEELQNFSRPSDDVLRSKLSAVEYDVTQEEGTEPPFRNEYWDEHRDGIYVNRISGEALFSSLDKYESGTGWPSFAKPLEPQNIVTREDHQLCVARTEVRNKHADSHLGHVFDDGPEPTGLRYCITPPPCVSCRGKILRRRVTASTRRFSKTKNNPVNVHFSSWCCDQW